MKSDGWVLGTLAVGIFFQCAFTSLSLAAHSLGQISQGDTGALRVPITISAEEAEHHLLEKVEPTYPPLARMARVEGLVRVEVLVNSDGTVARVVQSSGHPLLIKAAFAAVQKYRYKPFVEDGKTVPADFWVEIKFSLPVHKPRSVPFPGFKDYGSIIITMDTGYYSLKITGDGTVEFVGTNYVVVDGKHRGKITAAELHAMVAAFRSADFFSLDDQYNSGATDVYWTDVSIQIGAQRKAVAADPPGAPAALRKLEDTVADLSHSDQWVKGTAETVPGLLSESRDHTQTRETLSRALPAAATYSTTAVVGDLVRVGADVQRRDFEGCTALMLAAERGLPDMVRLLLSAGADPRMRDKFGRSALMLGAASGNVEVMTELLPAGMVNARSERGATALMAAAAAGNPDLVRMLLSARAQVNQRAVDGTTALIAGSFGDIDPLWDGEMMGRPRPQVPDEVVHRGIVVRLLLNAGADINARNKDGETGLFSLEDDAVRELIAHKVDLNIRNKDGQTALIETVSEDIAKLLVEAGANVNARDPKGRTALMEAADHNYVRKIRVLTTSNDLRINRRDHQGRTALMIAADDASPQCIKALLDAHADFKLRDKSGRTALQLAEAGLSNAREGYKIEGYRETIQHLRDAGAND
jgi:TonB family protein